MTARHFQLSALLLGAALVTWVLIVLVCEAWTPGLAPISVGSAGISESG